MQETKIFKKQVTLSLPYYVAHLGSVIGHPASARRPATEFGLYRLGSGVAISLETGHKALTKNSKLQKNCSLP